LTPSLRPPSGNPAIVHAIGTAVPDHDVHREFIAWAGEQIVDPRDRKLFARMADRSGIAHRWSVLPPTRDGGSPVMPGGFYACDPLPATAARMAIYAEHAPKLALAAIAALREQVALDGITHLVVASCTGFVAPGIDQIIARELGLSPNLERVLIGFMGCYAGVTALRTASHIVRSEPEARVLVVAVELSTLHLSIAQALEPLLAMLQFSDGAAAALMTSDIVGSEGRPESGAIALGRSTSLALDEGRDLIQWRIGDRGFRMDLSGEVPHRLQETLSDPQVRAQLLGSEADALKHFAVHPGGRSILDAVQRGLELDDIALEPSRAVLSDFGNMSSATILFVLARMMRARLDGAGVALAFGPGLAVEGIGFAPVA